MEYRLFNYNMAEQLTGDSRKILHLEDLYGDILVSQPSIEIKPIEIKHGMIDKFREIIEKEKRDGES